ncbi:MAG: toll/interleukin-1 receptor domain-containing protein [Gemmataceae bacterium]
MADLGALDRRRLEELFAMGGGYVLRFSDRTFREFFAETLDLDIDDEKYRGQGSSKAKRLRAFWKLESNSAVGKLLHALIDLVESDQEQANPKLVTECRKVAERLVSIQKPSAELSPETYSPKSPLCAFISYSWDSDDHKGWVRKLSEHLAAAGVEVILDQYELKLGHDRFAFMEHSVRQADVVLCVCTPAYVRKANDRASGVGVETSLMTPKFFNREKIAKQFIPIIRAAPADVPFMPDHLDALIYVDFQDDTKFALQMEELLRHLWNEPKHRKPALGNKPSFGM